MPAMAEDTTGSAMASYKARVLVSGPKARSNAQAESSRCLASGLSPSGCSCDTTHVSPSTFHTSVEWRSTSYLFKG
jgi:hypothetical protein